MYAACHVANSGSYALYHTDIKYWLKAAKHFSNAREPNHV